MRPFPRSIDRGLIEANALNGLAGVKDLISAIN